MSYSELQRVRGARMLNLALFYLVVNDEVLKLR